MIPSVQYELHHAHIARREREVTRVRRFRERRLNAERLCRVFEFMPVKLVDNITDTGARVIYSKPIGPRWQMNETQVDKLIISIAGENNIMVLELILRKRFRKYSWPRQEAMWTVHMNTDWSLNRIGRKFNNRDHTTVLYSIRAHARRNGLPSKRID